jgi:actin-related protein 2
MKLDDLGERNILLTEAALNPTKNRTKMAEVMFEKFGFKGLSKW